MAGRIRSIKPEILEDEKTAALPHLEWRLFVSLWLIADDYGNLRGDPTYVLGQTLWATGETRGTIATALEHLAGVGLLVRYVVRGQSYCHIAGWAKHQKVTHPGKPRMPGPDEADREYSCDVESLKKSSVGIPETLTPDLRPPTSDLDHDLKALSPARDPAVPTPVPVAKPTPDLGPLASTVPELAAEMAHRDAKPANPIPPGESAWHRRRRWWDAMLEADARLRASGIEPNAPAMPKAPAGASELNMNRCERQLLDGGFSPGEVDAKMRHIVLVAEAEARREGHRRWFKPALIWDPERAARAVDTSLDEASQARPPPRSSAGRAPAQRDVRVGQIQPKDPSAYPEGEIEIT